MSSVTAGLQATDRGRSWLIVLASALALEVGPTSILVYAAGPLLGPLEAQFGWSRAQASVALAIVLYTSAFLNPVQGMLVDRFGPRRVILVSWPLFAITLLLFTAQTGSLWLFYLISALAAFASIGLWSGPFNKVISTHFDRRLGLAIGIAAAGQGLGAVTLPVLTQFMVLQHGWQAAYFAFALMVITLGFIPSFFLIRQGDKGSSLAISETAIASPPSAILGRTLIKLLAAFFLLGIMTGGINLHHVPLLQEAGVQPMQAAGIASMVGIGLIVGRLFVGALLDRFFAPYVMLVVMIGPLLALGLYAAQTITVATPLFSFLLGIGIGAEVDVMGYLVKQYFGVANYGKAYGLLLGGFQLGAGLGAALGGFLRTARGNYSLSLQVLMLAGLAACLLLAWLPRYKRGKQA